MGAVALLPALPMLGGCGGDGLFSFTVGRGIDEQRVAGSPLPTAVLGDLFDAPIPLTVDVEEETRSRGTGPVTAIRLTRFALAVTPTAEGEEDVDDLAFVNRLDVFVESARDDSDLPRRQIATLPEPPAEGDRTLELDTDRGVNLEPYVEEGAVLTATATGTPPPDDVTFDGRIRLRFEVL